MSAGASPHILVIEDEPVTRATLTRYLDQNGYRVTEAANSEIAEKILVRDPPDLVLIDINLEGKDGLQITRELRAQSETGIILISGRTDDVDRIVGLEMGADDYVCKPFNRRELLARIKNLLRRTTALRHFSRSLFRFEGFTFNVNTRQLTYGEDDTIKLTRAEYELLAQLIRHPLEVQSRDRLVKYITHRQDSPDPRMVDVLVRRLRKKLQVNAATPPIITTSHGEGYVFTGRLE
ncbi:MAG TPA: response regulator [Albidovulum sp.]|uniref:response regulator n=1 Tax=Albidovulum sp. TaxID=1872424 RepID=UPI001DC97782|nr:response regulator [Paracoccaceae bacterium]MCP5377469.1 response regulator [Paracoccaceae bacterium]HRV62904.1 response regulator [Albidovulum sp.]